jgi:hypothetical protein
MPNCRPAMHGQLHGNEADGRYSVDRRVCFSCPFRRHRLARID